MLSQVAPLPAATAPFEVVLINPYELGRQPFALAEPAALLKREGFAVTCLDLSLQKLDPEILKHAGLVALYVGMHTATRIAVEALPHIRRLAPKAHLCVYGLYAPMNEALLRGLGVGTVLGGKLEPALVSFAERLRAERQRAHGPERAGHQPGQDPVRGTGPQRPAQALSLRPPGAAGRIHPDRRVCRGQPRLQALVPALPGGPGVPGNSSASSRQTW